MFKTVCRFFNLKQTEQLYIEQFIFIQSNQQVEENKVTGYKSTKL